MQSALDVVEEYLIMTQSEVQKNKGAFESFAWFVFKDNARSCINNIYKNSGMSLNIEFPTLFDLCCDLLQRGAIVNAKDELCLQGVVNLYKFKTVGRCNGSYVTRLVSQGQD